MGVFDVNVARSYFGDKLTQTKVAIETGTFLGGSTRAMAEVFTRVHTIELSEFLYAAIVPKFANLNIQAHLGNSADVLPKLIEQENQPLFFYLDAHWSGDDTVSWEQSNWSGYRDRAGNIIPTAYAGITPTPENQVPLHRELEIINTTCRHLCLICVDDIDKFDAAGNGLRDKGFMGEDWTHLNLAAFKQLLAPRVLQWDRTSTQLFIALAPV